LKIGGEMRPVRRSGYFRGEGGEKKRRHEAYPLDQHKKSLSYEVKTFNGPNPPHKKGGNKGGFLI